MPNEGRTRSHLMIWRHGRRVASSSSWSEMPRARASVRARSRDDTMS